MNQSLINHYKIVFIEKVLNIEGHNSITTKVPGTNNDTVSAFLSDWKDFEMIDNYLLPGIDSVINGEEEELETGSETFTVIVDPVSTTFYLDNVGMEYPTIPTVDFRDIVLGWRDFLAS